jgi:hypothetical protein
MRPNWNVLWNSSHSTPKRKTAEWRGGEQARGTGDLNAQVHDVTKAGQEKLKGIEQLRHFAPEAAGATQIIVQEERRKDGNYSTAD